MLDKVLDGFESTVFGCHVDEGCTGKAPLPTIPDVTLIVQP